MKEREKEERKPIDLIMWVGRCYYTIHSYIREARRLGCCKRIPPQLPENLVIDKSRVYLVHDTTKGEEEEEEEEERKPGEWYRSGKWRKWTKRGRPKVFGYFVVRGVEAVRPFPSKKLRGKGVKLVDKTTVDRRPLRECLQQKPGGLYLVSGYDMDEFGEEPKKKALRGTIELIKPPVQARLRRFRGFRYVWGDRIGKVPEKQWFSASVKAPTLHAVKPRTGKRRLPSRVTLKMLAEEPSSWTGKRLMRYEKEVVAIAPPLGLSRPTRKRSAEKAHPVTGEVHVPTPMVPYVTYDLNVFLIGETGTEETKTVVGKILVERLSFVAAKSGPIIIIPHGEGFTVTPPRVSAAAPPLGKRRFFPFKVSPRFEKEGQVKLFVDFMQDDVLLRRANADVAISRHGIMRTIIVKVKVPFILPLL